MKKYLRVFTAFAVLLLSVVLLVACGSKADAKVKKAKDDLKIEQILGDNTSKDEVKTDLDLITKSGDVNIVWSSSNRDVVTTDGKVTRPSEDTKVKLIANFELDDVKDKKEFEVTVVAKELDTNPDPAVAYYEGETSRFTEDVAENQAAKINLDADVFTVLGTVIVMPTYSNPIGLNLNGTIRLYSSRDDGNGNTLTILVREGYEITGVEFDFNEHTSPATSGRLVLGDNTENLTGEDLVNTVLNKEGLSIDGFSLTNTYIAESGANQIHINKITITYKMGTPSSKIDLDAQEPEKTDAELVAEAKEALSIDTKDITSDKTLNLPTEGLHDSEISWEVLEGEDHIDLETGEVTMPEDSNTIKLKATLKVGDKTETKEFTINLVHVPEVEGPTVTYTEDFENSNLTGSYTAGDFTGANGVTFVYLETRNSGDYPINGGGATLRNKESEISFTLPNGFVEFSFDYRKAFTGNGERKLQVIINDGLYETVPSEDLGDGAQEAVYKFEYVGIGEDGPTIIKLNNEGAQITINNISWTEKITEDEADLLEVMEEVTIEDVVLEDKTITLPTKKDDVTITWESSNTDIITDEGAVTVVPNLKYKIALTATFKLNDATMKKDYFVSVGKTGLIEIEQIEDIDLNMEVMIEGTIVDFPGNNQYLIEDATGTIVIYTFLKFEELALGNKVKVVGNVGEFNSVKQLEDIVSVELLEAATMHKVTFEIEDSDDIVVDVVAGYKVEKPKEDPTRDVYNFIGWFNEDLEDEFDFDTLITENLVIVAKWVAKTTEELIAEAKEDLTVDTSTITEDKTLELPTEGLHDVVITWEATEGSDLIDLATGEVTVSEEPATLKLEATLTLGDKVETKEFIIEVERMDESGEDNEEIVLVVNKESLGLTETSNTAIEVDFDGVIVSGLTNLQSKSGEWFTIKAKNDQLLTFSIPEGYKMSELSITYSESGHGENERTINLNDDTIIDFTGNGLTSSAANLNQGEMTYNSEELSVVGESFVLKPSHQIFIKEIIVKYIPL